MSNYAKAVLWLGLIMILAQLVRDWPIIKMELFTAPPPTQITLQQVQQAENKAGVPAVGGIPGPGGAITGAPQFIKDILGLFGHFIP